jgi:DNA-binding LytR/AlgR family response regulator
MPELTGINFMKIVGNKLKYILTTAYAEYALEGYEHNVVDYLLKPISFDRFQKSALKAQERFAVNRDSNDSYFFVKSSGQQHRINFNEILYIESIKDYVNIKTENQEYIVLDTLKSLENQLPENFARVHKSFILNLEKIEKIDVKNVFLNSGKEIPIGETYKSEFFLKIKK